MEVPTLFRQDLRSRDGLLLLICLTVGLIYIRVCFFSFVNYDDGVNIYANPLIAKGRLADFRRIWQAPYDNLYIPITYSLWLLQAKLGILLAGGQGQSLDPHLFHAVNLLTHLFNVVLVFGILLRLLRHDWAAVAGALVFGLHPVQVEAVAWVTGFKDLLCGFFSLAALYQYLLFVEAGNSASRRRYHYFLALAALTAAVLAKPAAVAVPVVVFFIALFQGRKDHKKIILELLPWFLVILPVVVLTKLAQPDSSQALAPNLWQRLVIAGDALFFYLSKIILPLDLGPDYGRTPVKVLAGSWSFAGALIVFVGVGMILWKGNHFLRCALGIFIAALLPVLGLVTFDFQNISTVADRYLYLAMLGPGLTVGWLIAGYGQKITRWPIIAALIIFGAASFIQTAIWKNSMTLADHALKINPASWIAANNLGITLAEGGRLDEAIAALKKSLAANPFYAEAYNNLGAVYREQGRQDEAIASLQKAINLGSKSPTAAFTLASIYEAKGQTAEAIKMYLQALLIRPDFPEALNNLADHYAGINRPEEAIVLLQKAISLSPDQARLYNNLARVYFESGRLEQARELLSRAITTDPGFAQGYNNLSRVYLALGEYDKAIDFADRAVALGWVDPAHLAALKPYRK